MHELEQDVSRIGHATPNEVQRLRCGVLDKIPTPEIPEKLPNAPGEGLSGSSLAKNAANLRVRNLAMNSGDESANRWWLGTGEDHDTKDGWHGVICMQAVCQRECSFPEMLALGESCRG